MLTLRDFINALNILIPWGNDDDNGCDDIKENWWLVDANTHFLLVIFVSFSPRDKIWVSTADRSAYSCFLYPQLYYHTLEKQQEPRK